MGFTKSRESPQRLALRPARPAAPPAPPHPPGSSAAASLRCAVWVYLETRSFQLNCKMKRRDHNSSNRLITHTAPRLHPAPDGVLRQWQNPEVGNRGTGEAKGGDVGGDTMALLEHPFVAKWLGWHRQPWRHRLGTGRDSAAQGHPSATHKRGDNEPWPHCHQTFPPQKGLRQQGTELGPSTALSICGIANNPGTCTRHSPLGFMLHTRSEEQSHPHLHTAGSWVRGIQISDPKRQTCAMTPLIAASGVYPETCLCSSEARSLNSHIQ